ncbi:MAG: hypothetical protein COX57_02065 [Alphaproteobacteria bacterium CG_4_10_14_0_2_um_filter_63_37]|nr:MAG: hypothetical protein COX57_02065 [Alphaproteobacteria bacterium CG_4_10_14_0_2_um_filter_63_37]
MITKMNFDVNGDRHITPNEVGPDADFPALYVGAKGNLPGSPFSGLWVVADVHVGPANGAWIQTLFLRRA